MEGVGEDGRFYLLDRPSNEEVQNRLWMLYLASEKKRQELKDELKFKVEQLRRKEERLLEWQNALSDKEKKLDNGEDNVCALMREIKVKDMLLMDKDMEIKKDREIEDNIRQCQEDVRREVEVC